MGTIRCNRCSTTMGRDKCPKCGGESCHIVIYWQGKHRKISKAHDGFGLNKARANAVLGEIRVAIGKGTFNPIDYTEEKIIDRKMSTKLTQWLNVRKKEMEEGSLSPSSYFNMVGHVNNHILPYLGHYDVKSIRQENLEDFKDHITGVKSKTKKNIFVTLHAFFVWLWKRGIRDIPPFPEIPDAHDSDEQEAIDFDEQQEELRKIPEGVIKDMIEFGMETGIRPGELVTLRVTDIDSKTWYALIGRTVSAYSFIRDTTKGGHKDVIPLSDRAVEMTKRNIVGKFPEDFLFCKPDKRRFSVKSPNYFWKKFTGHDLTYKEASRHSFATQLADNGADAYEIKAAIRHTDIRVSQKYVHKHLERLREKVNRRGTVVELKREDADKK
jgi:site-specific recombinase XerD